MHTEVVQFLASCRDVNFDDAVVYEVGSLNVNGQARACFLPTWRKWVGLDLKAGDGVDLVGDAVRHLPHMDPADVVVSTEVLEHYRDWRTLVGVMCNAVKPGGWLIITCAGRGRPVHSADGGPHLLPDEHYRNVELAELVEVAADHGVTLVHGEEGPPGDTRFLGRKVMQ